MTHLDFPKVIFGTSGLGNLYVALDDKVKTAIVEQSLRHAKKPVLFDSAGKYGAGLALESLGKSLKDLKVSAGDVQISNKLGWLRTELKTPEPTFEPGVWKDLKYDAVQCISHQGILDCYEQGNELLNGYPAQHLSVHDPDEYLNAAANPAARHQRYQDILSAYDALIGLKKDGKIKSIGVGAKDWHIVQKITADVKLDWVMIANSMTIHDHPDDLVVFMKSLQSQEIPIINSAVFNGGFLTGVDFYNYKAIDFNSEAGKALQLWRAEFYKTCEEYSVSPATACVQFGFHAPGVRSIALNTTNPMRVEQNVKMTETIIPKIFWDELIRRGLIKQIFL